MSDEKKYQPAQTYNSTPHAAPPPKYTDYAPPSEPPPPLSTTDQHHTPQTGRTPAEEEAYLERLRTWAKIQEQTKPGDGTISNNVTPMTMLGWGIGGYMPTVVDPHAHDSIKYVPRADPEENERKYEGRHGLKGLWDSVRPAGMGRRMEGTEGSETNVG